jgi:predicted alpha/beta hydrolase family esterase
MRLPYTGVEFTKDGSPADRAQFDAATAMIRTCTDVLMISHGWNNDIAGAVRLFTALADNVDLLLAGRPGSGRTLAVVGLLWPSKQWGSDAADTAGAGSGPSDPVADLKARIATVVENPDLAARLTQLAGQVEDSAEARAEFVGILRALMPPQTEIADDDAPPDELRTGEPDDLFATVRQDGQSPAGEVGRGLLDFLTHPAQAAQELLNVTTFYVMKERAGTVGSRGVAELLAAVHQADPDVRIHLVGHSFGARVVTAATAATDVPISSVSLLQGAFSHRALAARDNAVGMPDGAFRRALTGGELCGPMVVTYTQNDKAVSVAYALASRLAHQVAARIGDADDPYGGIGANGAVGTAEALAGDLGDENTAYTYQRGRVHNLHADKFIASHSDVTNPAVANAVLAAVMSV